MSTKAIREALEELTRHGTTDCGTIAAAREVMRKHAAALAEVEAIERAARIWYAVVIGVESSPASDTFAPFERIAIDAPKHEEKTASLRRTFVQPDVDSVPTLPRCASPGCPHHVMNGGMPDLRPTSRWCYGHTEDV